MQKISDDLRLRIQASQSLPSLPAVALQILEQCRKPDASVAEIARLIGRDPALTVKVLKVVNSPLYGLRSRVTTLSHSVTLLGLNAVRSIALSFSLIRGLRRTDGSSFDHLCYWRRSIDAAVAAQTLADHLRLPNREEVFLAALLQDVGMLVLSEALPEYGEIVARADGDHAELASLEQSSFGVDHAGVSAWLLGSWKLPDLHQQAADRSHDPQSAEVTDPVQRKIISVVALSALLADIWVVEDTEAAAQLAAMRAREWLEIDDVAFGAILEKIATRLPETSALFEVDLGSPEAVSGILDQAKEALVLLNIQSAQQAPQTEATAGGLAERNRALQERSQRDPLTGLRNRAHLDEVLKTEFERANSRGLPISIIFADIDHFKKVNDSWGHQAGDRVLISVGHLLAGGRRKFDCVARYGGEEFVLVLPDTDQAAATLLAERLRTTVAERQHRLEDGRSIQVTISLGCATHRESYTFNGVAGLINAADKALYAAKNTGRNRVVALGGAVALDDPQERAA
ncbi:MAG: HDOD domain-containing protein [Candidatus Eisenbacteria bacterium]|nr:HDOD domain-containing protein [Candidatus Eisenbacteria bacterium]